MIRPQLNPDRKPQTNPLAKVNRHDGIVKMYDTTTNHAMDDRIRCLLKDRDKEGISILYDQFSANIYGLILRITKNEVDACEALKSTFIKIWEESEHTDFTNRSLKKWVLGLACKEAAKISKKSISQLPNIFFQ